jgi:predicted AAA+ superfamily ATPase
VTEIQHLYDRATKILTNIECIKSITQKIIDEKEMGIKIDKKEILNLASIIKQLMERYNAILECIAKSHISFEEKETIMDMLDTSRKSIMSLNNAINVVQKKII